MKIEIVRCPSGFYAVMVNSQLFYGAATSYEQAEQIAQKICVKN